MKTIKKISFTKEGHERIKKEYQKLLASRKDAVDTLAKARELGDLSENGLYKAARSRLSSIDNQLFRLSSLIKYSDVIEATSDETIGIDSKVKLEEEGGRIREFHIVGEYEADPLKNKISIISPIGRALMGKSVGDNVTINIPAGRITYKILQIKK